jgi:CRP-like cAMP-binding protein
MATVEDILRSTPIFSMLPKKEVAKLAKFVNEATFPAGSVLTEEEKYGTVFTVIAEGEATVTVNGRTVRKLGPGDFFGEMALIDRDLRSATVTADTELRTLMLTQWVFRPFAIKHPDTIWALLELMVKRVREAQSPQD